MLDARYSPKRPPIICGDELVDRICKRCTVIFPGTRAEKYCEACKPAARARTDRRSQDRAKKRKLAARAARISGAEAERPHTRGAVEQVLLQPPELA